MANGGTKDGEVTLVAPNGAELPDKYHPNELVEHVLKKAVQEFGKLGQLDPSKQYVLVYGETALEGSLSLRDAGVGAGSRLKVRAKAIPGDGACTRS